MTGIVAYMNSYRGFGLIDTEDGRSVLFYASNIKEGPVKGSRFGFIDPGTTVEFELSDKAGPLEALYVTVK